LTLLTLASAASKATPTTGKPLSVPEFHLRTIPGVADNVSLSPTLIAAARASMLTVANVPPVITFI